VFKIKTSIANLLYIILLYISPIVTKSLIIRLNNYVMLEIELKLKLNLLVREIRNFEKQHLSEVKRASLRALARDSTLYSGGKVPPFLRCALWLVGRSVGASLRRRAGPIGMKCQGAFHHVRTISQGKKKQQKKKNKANKRK